MPARPLPPASLLVPRYWTPPEQPPGLDGAFLAPRARGEDFLAALAFGPATDHHRTSLEASTTQCLLLLGPPGMGKTTELRRMYETAEGRKHFINLAEVTAGADVERLVSCAEVRSWGGEGGTLFLDAFDEGRADLGPLADVLARVLREVDPQGRNAVRVTCRDADRPRLLETAFQDHYGAVEVVALAPLQRADARAIASRALGDGEADRFMAEMSRANVESLAAIPLTLSLLVRVFRESQRLPESRGALFNQAVHSLAEEWSPARRASGRSGHVDANQRVELAARVAVLLRLSGRTHLHLGLASEVAPGALSASDVQGDARSGTTWTGTVPLDQALRDLVLHSGLFAGQADTYRFVHLTFEEFLAAKYLADQNTAPSTSLALLSHPETGLRSELRETAAVLAELRPAVRDRLLALDPEAALRYGADGLDDLTRERAVEAFLSAHDRGAIDFWDRLPHAERLVHPGLIDQLQRWIVDDERYHAARKAALVTAQDARQTALVPLAVEMALDGSQTPELRHLAVLVALDLDPDSRESLSQLAAPEKSDSYRWTAFAVRRALFPTLLSVVDLTRLLAADGAPGAPSAAGARTAAERFAQDAVLDGDLSRDTLLGALDWVAAQTAFGVTARPFADAVVEAAAERSPDDEVVALALARTLLGPGPEVRYATPFEWPVDSSRRGGSQSSRVREAVASAAVQALAERDLEFDEWDDATAPLVYGLDLLRHDDTPFVLDQIRAEPSARIRRVWVAVLWRTFHPGPHTDTVLMACLATPAVWELLPIYAQYFAPVELVGLVADHLRASHQRTAGIVAEQERKQKKARPVPPTPLVVGQATARVLAGEVLAWPQVAGALSLHPDNKCHFRQPFHDDFHQAATWSLLTQGQRDDIARAASIFLCAEPAGPNSANPLHAAAAFRVLAEHAPASLDALEEDVWRAHAPALVRAPFNSNGSDSVDRRADLLARAYSAAPSETMAALVEEVVRSASEPSGRTPTVLYAATRFWDAPLRKAVVDALRLLPPARGDAWAGRENLLEMLLDYQSPEAAGLALEQLWTDSAASLGSDAASIWYAVRAFRASPTEAWPLVSDRVMHDDLYAEAFFRRLSFFRRGGLSLQIDPEVLADLYLRLHAIRPTADDPPTPDGTFQWDTDHGLRDLRHELLSAITHQGTRASVAAVERLARDAPPGTDLVYAVSNARQQWARLDPRFPDPADVLLAASDPDAAPIRSDAELQAATLRAIAALQAELTDQEQATSPDLWNTAPSILPKGEIEISDYVARYLRRSLAARGVDVSREAEVYGGSETDIRLSAPLAADRGALVVVEVKGAWEKGAVTGLSGQLAQRYLRQAGRTHGVHLVVSFERTLWDPVDWRRRIRANPENLNTALQAEAASVRGDGYEIIPVVLRVRAHRNAL